MTVQIQHDSLILDHVRVRFQRTLRIPDDGRTYPLPPSLGAFPIRRVADYADRVPSAWVEHGGVFLPMYQREAMWLQFSAPEASALKVGVGKVCAISGNPWSNSLDSTPQNYVVTGQQPWLDGIASGKGTVRQFVAMPLGRGYTVEGQVTGEETHGGVQLQVHRAKPGMLPKRSMLRCRMAPPAACAPQASGAMGIAAGGTMKQKIYPDRFGLQTWETQRSARVFVHIVNSMHWREITGEEPPSTPVSARSYAKAGFPWFDLYDEHLETVDPSETLKNVKSVRTLDAESSTLPLQDDGSVSAGPVHPLGLPHVQDGSW